MRLLLLSLSGLLFTAFSLFAQSEYKAVEHGEKYFISAYYGNGSARWVSHINNTNLYDQRGNAVIQSNSKFKVSNRSHSYSFDVLAPVSFLRIGLGMGFEDFYLDKLLIYENEKDVYIAFKESFRFDKISAIVEIPFKNKKENEHFTFNINTRFGYYGYSNLRSANLFGGPFVGKSFFWGVGFLADYEVLTRIYLFAYPNVEYKYFSSSKVESPSAIKHSIYTANAVVGIRINIKK
jgi:hypothetical protein